MRLLNQVSLPEPGERRQHNRRRSLRSDPAREQPPRRLWPPSPGQRRGRRRASPSLAAGPGPASSLPVAPVSPARTMGPAACAKFARWECCAAAAAMLKRRRLRQLGTAGYGGTSDLETQLQSGVRRTGKRQKREPKGNFITAGPSSSIIHHWRLRPLLMTTSTAAAADRRRLSLWRRNLALVSQRGPGGGLPTHPPG